MVGSVGITTRAKWGDADSNEGVKLERLNHQQPRVNLRNKNQGTRVSLDFDSMEEKQLVQFAILFSASCSWVFDSLYKVRIPSAPLFPLHSCFSIRF